MVFQIFKVYVSLSLFFVANRVALFFKLNCIVLHCFLQYTTFFFCIKGITLCSVQGYWTPSLLFDFILRCGSDVVGTVARCFWYRFTFVKGKSNGTEADKYDRTEIPMKGQKDVFYKTLK